MGRRTRCRRWMAPLVVGLAVGGPIRLVGAQEEPPVPVGFVRGALAGAEIQRATVLAFGPDGRLYAARQDGLVQAFTIQRLGAGDYAVVETEQITAVRSLPNHDDGGAPNAAVTGRLITGMAVTGTAARPVLYVTSSDPRTGAFLSGDSGLDTNSGVLSRLRWNGSGWSREDLVRGLPRSEERHATNGIALDEGSGTAYLAQGGNTNHGAPSNLFAQLPEVALSAAVLSVDLGALGSTPYDLPTIDDPARAGGTDAGDPFGGNDGQNQARLVPGGPVQVFMGGLRNAYDVVRTRAGHLFTVDNGGNAGWGDLPVGEGPGGVCTNDPVEAGVTDQDTLHLVTAGAYGGHPNPTRGNTANTFGGGQHPVATADARECDAVPTDGRGALATFTSSTNGLVEYTAGNFGGALAGDLLAASLDGTVYRVELAGDGTTPVRTGPLFTGAAISALDVAAVGDGGPFPGTVWVSDYWGGIVAFEPNDYGGSSSSCGGGPGAIDEDGDNYTNADELDNGTDPCSSADVPPDWDDDGVSNRNDPDDDDDGRPDTSDPFALDASDGGSTHPPVSLTWEAEDDAPGGLLNLGFTGLMSDGRSDYASLFDAAGMTGGGASGLLTVDAVGPGTARGAANDQRFAFQLGVDADPARAAPFTVRARLPAPFAGSGTAGGRSVGVFVGTGSQDDYVEVAVVDDGSGAVRVTTEVTGTPVDQIVPASVLTGGAVDLFLTVDPATATLQARWGTVSAAGTVSPVAAGSAVLVPQSWFTSGGLAVGIIASSAGGPPFPASWDHLEVVPGLLAAPVAAAGADSSVKSRAGFTLDGSGSSGTAPLGVLWEQVAGPAAVLRDPRSLRTEVTGVQGPATLRFRLTVTDPHGLASSDEVVVTVRRK